MTVRNELLSPLVRRLFLIQFRPILSRFPLVEVAIFSPMRSWFSPIILMLLAGVLPAGVCADSETITVDLRGIGGADVWLDGSWTGRLPLEPFKLSRGEHEFRVEKRGYMGRTDRVWLHPLRGQLLIYDLTPKTRSGAVYRSFVIPGWGALYSDHKWSALFYIAVETGLLGYAYSLDQDFQDQLDAYHAAVDHYTRSTGNAEIEAARTAMNEAYDELSPIESDRDDMLLTALAVYGVSVLDAFLRFPYGDLGEGRLASLTPYHTAESSGLALRMRF